MKNIIQNNESFLFSLYSNYISEKNRSQIETYTNLINNFSYIYPTIFSYNYPTIPIIPIELKDNNKYFPIYQLNQDNSSNKEEKYESEKNKLFFIDNTKKSLPKFIVESKIGKNIKRGRKKCKKENIKIHGKNASDNLLRKIQVHYISFIISFLNDILKYLNYQERFLKLDYRFKSDINKIFVKSLKEKDIKEIVCYDISSKYKIEKNFNISIYEKIKENKLINKILSENYLLLFKKFYYKSCKIINLSEYGLDKDIILSDNVKMFNDLLKDIESKDENKEYIKKNRAMCL